MEEFKVSSIYNFYLIYKDNPKRNEVLPKNIANELSFMDILKEETSKTDFYAYCEIRDFFQIKNDLTVNLRYNSFMEYISDKSLSILSFGLILLLTIFIVFLQYYSFFYANLILLVAIYGISILVWFVFLNYFLNGIFNIISFFRSRQFFKENIPKRLKSS